MSLDDCEEVYMNSVCTYDMRACIHICSSMRACGCESTQLFCLDLSVVPCLCVYETAPFLILHVSLCNSFFSTHTVLIRM